MNPRNIIIFAMFILVIIIPVSIAGPSGQLRLNSIDATYDPSDEGWNSESYVTSDTNFDLDLTNHNSEDIYHLYVLVAVDRDPAGNVEVKVNGNTISPFDGIITTNNNARVAETVVYKGNNWVSFEYPGHGIYNYNSNTHFEVVEIPITGDGKLSSGETISVPVEIKLISGEVKVHFDAVGANNIQHSSLYETISFVPPSKDLTYNIPEFPALVLPVGTIFAIMLFINRKKKEE